MQALVVGGGDGYCFIEKDASVDPRAGSKAPEVVLRESFITNQAGSPPSPNPPIPRALPGRMVREDVPPTRSNGFLTWSLQSEDIACRQQPSQLYVRRWESKCHRGVKMLKV